MGDSRLRGNDIFEDMKTTEEILKEIKERLDQFEIEAKVENIGTVVSVGDGVASVTGLSNVAMGELVEFEDKSVGLAFDLQEDFVSIILMSEATEIRTGSEVKKTGRYLSVGVSEDLLGRVINPLGQPLDGGTVLKLKEYMPLERLAPGVVERRPVDIPMMTGIKAIDAMTAIGRGQRQLIIGDRGTGKTSIILDTIINQKNGHEKNAKRKPVICVYVAIGQKQVNVAQSVQKLSDLDAMEYTIVVAANASDPAPLQYLAPFAGCAIAEYFAQKGQDVLIAYDDLTKQAWAYRQISLVLKRPAGREAYPGDIFFLHSRLLERAVQYSDKNGGGSITALPVIETQAGDVSAYIPTNVISITDGQIFLETDLFNAGTRPAMNVGISVSRVGGAAQTPIMKKIAGPLRLDLSQYRELAAFAQFGSDLDKATQTRLDRGARISEMFKQQNYHPLSLPMQVASIWAVINGYMDDVPVAKVKNFENEFHEYLARSEEKLIDLINKEEKLTDEVAKGLQKAVEKFKKGFQVE